MTTITFYKSIVCPRCHVANLWVTQLLREFPNFRIEEVEVLTNRTRLRDAGVRTFPALVCGERQLSCFYLTKGRIRRFFESL